MPIHSGLILLHTLMLMWPSNNSNMTEPGNWNKIYLRSILPDQLMEDSTLLGLALPQSCG